MKAADIRRIFKKPGEIKNPNPRRTLTSLERAKLRAKTKGRCHVCGDKLGKDWQAGHIVPHLLGGDHSFENFLPVHRECNRVRWSYSPAVLRLIMRFGVYAKHEIRHETELGHKLVDCAAKNLDRTWKRRQLP